MSTTDHFWGGCARLLTALIAVVLCASISCSTLRVAVDSPTFKAEDFFQDSDDGLRLEVHPIEGTHAYWDLFDEDLPKAGIGAVWVRLSNTRSDPVDVKDLDWILKMGTRNFTDLDSRQVLEQFYKGTGRRLHSIAAAESSRRHLEKKIFKQTSLSPSQTHEGFVFVRIPANSAPKWYENGVLIGRGIRLGNGKKTQIDVALSHNSSEPRP